MYPELGLGLITLVVFIWLGVLTFLVLSGRGFLNKLFPKSGERDIRHKFEEILRSIDGFEESLRSSNQRLEDLEKLELTNIKRVSLDRYNPYNDTGGDQSFTVALLDSLGNGIVITSLHARSGTRVFAKPVRLGKADKYQFSVEEEEIIKGALNIKK